MEIGLSSRYLTARVMPSGLTSSCSLRHALYAWPPIVSLVDVFRNVPRWFRPLPPRSANVKSPSLASLATYQYIDPL